MYLQYVIKCAFEWGYKAGFTWNRVIQFLSKPHHSHLSKHSLDPDAMLSCFFIWFLCTSFILFSWTFVPPHSSHFFVHFLIASGSKSSWVTYPFWNGPICVIRLDSLPLHFSVAVFYPSALPAFESKAGTAYMHLSLAFKKNYILFFFSWKTCLNI